MGVLYRKANDNTSKALLNTFVSSSLLRGDRSLTLDRHERMGIGIDQIDRPLIPSILWPWFSGVVFLLAICLVLGAVFGIGYLCCIGIDILVGVQWDTHTILPRARKFRSLKTKP